MAHPLSLIHLSISSRSYRDHAHDLHEFLFYTVSCKGGVLIFVKKKNMKQGNFIYLTFNADDACLFVSSFRKFFFTKFCNSSSLGIYIYFKNFQVSTYTLNSMIRITYDSLLKNFLENFCNPSSFRNRHSVYTESSKFSNFSFFLNF